MGNSLNDRIRRLCEQRGLRFQPWEIPPWDCDFGPSPWPPGVGASDTWGPAQRLRRKLIAELTKAGAAKPE